MSEVRVAIDENGVTIQGTDFSALTAEIQQEFQTFAQNAFRELRPLVESLGEIRLTLAPNAEQPTTASATVGEVDLPSVTLQVDPSGVSAVFPNMMQQLISLTSMIGATTQSSRNDIIYDSLTNALRILINKYGYEPVITELNLVFKNGGISRINSNFKEIVKKSIANIIKDLNQYGPENIPEPDYRRIVEADLTPVPDNVLTVIPEGYVEIYYNFENDPYPGFEQWYSKTTKENAYIEREIGSYYFESMQEDIQGTSEIELAEALGVYIENDELDLTVKIFNDLLAEQAVNIKNNSMEKAVGKGASFNPAVLQQFLGYVASSIDLQVSVQLPNSVLNTSAIQQSLDAFSENIAMVRNIRDVMNQAMQLPSALSDISNINISQIMGSLGISVDLNVDLGQLGVQFNSDVFNDLTNVVSGLETGLASLQNTVELASEVLNDGITITVGT